MMSKVRLRSIVEPAVATKMALAKSKLPWLVKLFLIGLLIPFIFKIGPLHLSVYVAVLSLGIFPFLVLWLTGSAGRIRLPDIALLMFCFWCILSFVVVHGVSFAIEPSGILFIETMGAYLLGRLFVRSCADFYRVVRIVFWLILFLLPIALAESVIGRGIALDFARSIYDVPSNQNMDPRLGLRRAQVVFAHPILFGVFCSAGVAMVYFVLGYGKNLVHRLISTTIVVFTAGLSLSSGPLTAVGAQVALIAWNEIFKFSRRRWYILGSLFLAGLTFIIIFANRSPAQILISFVAFNKSTASNRLRIWEYGSASVMNNPLFGIGRNDWERPVSMVSSVDMFWLVPAMRHGVLAGLLLQVVFFGIILAVIAQKNLSRQVADYRTGYVISLVGLYMAGWTVHYWDSVYVFLMFLLGCGYCFVGETAGGRVEPVGSSVQFPASPHRPSHCGRDPEIEALPLREQETAVRPPLRYSRQVRMHTGRDES